MFFVCAVCECLSMLGCTTVPVAPYHMLSSVGMLSPLDYVILERLTPLHGCGNHLDPTECPRGGDVVSFIYGLFFINMFFTLTPYSCSSRWTCRQPHVWRSRAFWKAINAINAIQSWQEPDMCIPDQTHASDLLERLGNRKWCSTCCMQCAYTICCWCYISNTEGCYNPFDRKTKTITLHQMFLHHLHMFVVWLKHVLKTALSSVFCH